MKEDWRTINLIQITGGPHEGEWYWSIDDRHIGFFESESYETENEAWVAIIEGTIKWDAKHFIEEGGGCK